MKRCNIGVLWEVILLLSLWQSAYPLTLPASYGKTQFIIGAPHEKELRVPEKSRQATTKPSKEIVPKDKHHGIAQVFFAPDDDVRAALLALIAAERESILMAAYMITDKKIVQALIDAHKRGVHIEVITDQTCLRCEQGKIAWLQEQGVPVYVYIGETAGPKSSNLMHNKFIVFGNNIENKRLVWTGSFNFTESAQKYNQENAVLLRDTYSAQKFGNQFDVIKNRCFCLTKNNITHVSTAQTHTPLAKNTKRKKTGSKRTLIA
jgi:phosphatidylserine/phosphatidylglycerophosphate/cardiolipin synthase-like enzyme